jgi:hypothetical protein
LYQLIGTTGLVARSRRLSDTGASGHLEQLLSLTLRSQAVYVEFAGQDAALLGIDTSDQPEVVLIQFKYSRDAETSFGVDDLLDVVDALLKSSSRVKSDRVGYGLVTNRALSTQAEKLIHAAVTEEKHIFLDDKGRGRKRRKILKALHPTRVSLDEWTAAVEEEAARFGCLTQEFPAAIDSLVGNLHKNTALKGTFLLSEIDFAQAFAGHRSAKRLEPRGELRNLAAKNIEEYEESLWLGEQPLPPRPHLVQLREAAKQRALVVLSGDGGCGKSVLLYHWACALVASGALDQTVFTRVETILKMHTDLLKRWAADLLCKWSGLGNDWCPRSGEQTEVTLRRFLTAANHRSDQFRNQSWRPMLHLALDGVDETEQPDRERSVRELVEAFWQIDKKRFEEDIPATLLVTCRDSSSIKTWLNLRGPGGQERHGTLKEINVGDFSDEELLALALDIDPDAAVEIERAMLLYRDDLRQLRGPSALPLSAASQASQKQRFYEGDTPSDVKPEILVSLYHPAMWNAFIRLSKTMRISTLEGDQSGLDSLAYYFVDRLLEKARAREPSLLKDKSTSYPALHRIARHFQDSPVGTRHPHSEWVTAAASHEVPLERADALWREARSGGLTIVDDNNMWGWKHPLVHLYLLQHPQLPATASRA